VKKSQPSAAEAAAVKAFLNWTVTTGNGATFLTPVLFQPLPSRVLTISQALINSISG